MIEYEDQNSEDKGKKQKMDATENMRRVSSNEVTTTLEQQLSKCGHKSAASSLIWNLLEIQIMFI